MSEMGTPDQFHGLIKRLETPRKSMMTQTEIWQERYAAATVIRILVKELHRCRKTYQRIIGDQQDHVAIAKEALAFLDRLPL